RYQNQSMENRAKDYYDIPNDLLPMPNFAYRPASDISMLDGTTSMDISSSSSDDDSDGSTSQPPSPTKHLEWALSRPETPRPQSRSLSDDEQTIERPRLRKKAQTAPPGALCSSSYVPPQPRRAISTRLARSNTLARRNLRSDPSMGSSSIVTMPSSDDTAGPQRQLPEVGATIERGDAACTEDEQEESPKSFSRKARVKQTLKKKQIQMLNTDNSGFEPKKLSSSPSSMMSTPRELYVRPQQRTNDEPLPSLSIRKRTSIMSMSPIARSPSAQSDTRSREEFVNGTCGDSRVDETRHVYVPGPICLEERPMKPRRDSCASTDALDAAREGKANSFSDMVCLDGIVMFFEEFGVVEQITEGTLDEYWLRESQDDKFVVRTRRLSVSSMDEQEPRSHSQTPSSRGTKFYFSSASSTASLPASGISKRQRTRLRKFLSPALPGSGFLKTPAS
ncbi:hypothetical protein BKA66DRAFT_406356, partial [Pyrenochaeta sp. MPI-SDFR-AT-0127]